MNLSEYIVPENVREELENSAKTASDALWRIARLCLWVYKDFKMKREGGDLNLAGVDDYRVWRACGGYARKSADRIKTLVVVAAEYPVEVVRDFTNKYGEWDFGYYERTWRYEDIEREAIFEFIAQVRDGKFPNLPASRLGVGEFIASYEWNVRHLQSAKPPMPVGVGSVFYRGLPFGEILTAAQRLREGLRDHLIKPKVRRFVELVNELEASMPGVLEELEIDNQVVNSVK